MLVQPPQRRQVTGIRGKVYRGEAVFIHVGIGLADTAVCERVEDVFHHVGGEDDGCAGHHEGVVGAFIDVEDEGLFDGCAAPGGGGEEVAEDCCGCVVSCFVAWWERRRVEGLDVEKEKEKYDRDVKRIL
jgi:hypothetical protein